MLALFLGVLKIVASSFENFQNVLNYSVNQNHGRGYLSRLKSVKFFDIYSSSFKFKYTQNVFLIDVVFIVKSTKFVELFVHNSVHISCL
jgi:hypothetical protein